MAAVGTHGYAKNHYTTRMPTTLVRQLRNAAALVAGALLSACTNVGLQAINVPSYLATDPRAERDIAYGDRPHQKLDLFLPPDSVEDRRQLVVFIYGGAWTAGNRSDYYFVAQTLASAGYTVAIPDYIKYPHGAFPEFVTDIALSIGWLTEAMAERNAVDDIILMGHSAGAHTGALLLTDDRYLRDAGVDKQVISAFIGLAGPYGFKPQEQRYKDIFANLPDFNEMRPLHFADGDEPPMLLVHGDDDTTVLPVNTRQFAEKVNAAGGSAETRFYPGVGHVAPVLAFSRAPLSETAIRDDVLDFLASLDSLAPLGSPNAVSSLARQD
ncbi:MAG: alpha/beta hydrolase [Halioglobus sp.]